MAALTSMIAARTPMIAARTSMIAARTSMIAARTSMIAALTSMIAALTSMIAALASACSAEGPPPGLDVAESARWILPLPSSVASADPTQDAGADAALAEAEEPADEPLPDGPVLVAIAMETYVHQRPNARSQRLGYLRAGAIVRRSAASVGNDGCGEGWYRIAPRGYVCVGKVAALDHHAIADAVGPGPRRGDPFPYRYVMSRSPAPHLYVRLPSIDTQHHVEGRPFTGDAMSPWARAELKWLGPADAVSEFLESGADLPKPFGAEERLRFPTHRGRAKPKTAFGLIATYEHTGRRFGLTSELDIVAIDRTRVVRPSAVRGVVMDVPGIPAFVMHVGGKTYSEVAPGKFRPSGKSGFRSGWTLTGKTSGVTLEQVQSGAAQAGYVETTSGAWLPAQGLRVGLLGRDEWGHAKKGKRWIDVSIQRQILIAYEGETPVFAALVSTGRDGMGDPETTSATVRGVFFVQTKHLSTTMDGTGAAPSRELEDVPYVQYFHNNYALHGAYWHDEFGHVKSNGCVNLSPADAAWLFEWTDPVVPAGWHGAVAPKGGTLIYIHA